MTRSLLLILVLFPLGCEVGPEEPSIAVVEPDFGSIAGGETVTVYGNHFGSAVQVMLGDVIVDDVEVVSDDELRFVTPPALESSVDLVISTGQAQTRQPDGFTYQDPAFSPQVLVLSPDTGHRDGGTEVAFSGVNFCPGVEVYFQDLPAAQVTVHGANQMSAVTPAMPLGSLDVRIVNPDGRQALVTEGFVSQCLTPDEANILLLVNQARADAGLSALVVDPALCAAARAHCQDMIDRCFYGHVNPDGLGPRERVLAQGVAFDAVGENLSAATPTPMATMDAWRNSPGHWANILDPTYTKIGIGMKTGGIWGYYWAQDFIATSE